MLLKLVAFVIGLGVLVNGQAPCCPASQFRVRFSGQMGVYDETTGDVTATRRYSDISVDSSDPDDFRYRSNRLVIDIYTNELMRETIHTRGDRQYRYNDTHCERQNFRRAVLTQCITDDWELVGSSHFGVGEHTINFHAWRRASQEFNVTMTVTDNCVLLAHDFTAGTGTRKAARANVITGYTAGVSDPSIFDLPARCANL